MEVADGEEARESTRSRGLLAGRLAVKIEICTDSSMRGGGRVWRGRRGWAWKCSGPKIGEPNLPRIEFDEARSLLVFSARPRAFSLSLPVYSVSYSRFVLPACFSLSLFLSSSYSIFAGRYKMSYSYEAHIARGEETRSVFTKPSLVFVIFPLLVNHASSRCAFVSVIVKRE